jgi:hypothetical protein
MRSLCDLQILRTPIILIRIDVNQVIVSPWIVGDIYRRFLGKPFRKSSSSPVGRNFASSKIQSSWS